MTANGKIESFDDTNEKRKTYVELEEQFFLGNSIDDTHFRSTDFERTFCRGIFCTGEASYQVFSTTDIYHPTGAFEPEALGNRGMISFLQEKPA